MGAAKIPELTKTSEVFKNLRGLLLMVSQKKIPDSKTVRDLNFRRSPSRD
jgi:hypothetical protein